jgi:hypothetical protein
MEVLEIQLQLLMEILLEVYREGLFRNYLERERLNYAGAMGIIQQAEQAFGDDELHRQFEARLRAIPGQVQKAREGLDNGKHPVQLNDLIGLLSHFQAQKPFSHFNENQQKPQESE